MERDGTGWNGTRTEQYKKEEQERNDLTEGPRSRTERNDLKKVGTCPALPVLLKKFLRSFIILV